MSFFGDQFGDAPRVGDQELAEPPRKKENIITITKLLANLDLLNLDGTDQRVYFIGLLPGDADVTDVFILFTDVFDGTETSD